jgi:hypothetical protein
MSGAGKVVAAGLGALLLLGVIRAIAGSNEDDRPSPPQPNGRTAHLPARRVHEWRRCIVDEHGVEQVALCYAPTDAPQTAPWAVTAWYDAKRDAEIIRVEFNPSLRNADVNFAVLRNTALDPDRRVFRNGASFLWPDDKWNDRVVYRYKNCRSAGCFLIDVTVGDETTDFYHESLRQERAVETKEIKTPVNELALVEIPPPPPPSELTRDFKAYWGDLAEIRATRDDLDAAELNEDDKKELGKFLDQRLKQVRTKYLGNANSIDYMAPRR